MINNELLRLIEKESIFFNSKIHGLQHWRAVERNGLYLSQFTGADRKVVSLFAYFHDCMRENEWIDPEHGLRGAIFGQRNINVLNLDDNQFEIFFKACQLHTVGRKINCPTIGTCWDADRLDIGRVGKVVDSSYLFSQEAKRIADVCDEKVLLDFNVSDFKKDFNYE